MYHNFVSENRTYGAQKPSLVPWFINTATYFEDADEHRQPRPGLAGFRGPKGSAARRLQGNPSGVRRRCFSASLKIRDRIYGIVYLAWMIREWGKRLAPANPD
jgi:hypothetical protein